jgi:hypothetical protein
VKVFRVVEVQGRQQSEDIGLDCGDQQLERRHADDEDEADRGDQQPISRLR